MNPPCQSDSRLLTPTQCYSSLPHRSSFSIGKLLQVLIQAAGIHHLLVPAGVKLTPKQNILPQCPREHPGVLCCISQTANNVNTSL